MSISGACCDELCFDFLSPSLCFLLRDCELDGASALFWELLSCFGACPGLEGLGLGTGGASAISESESEDSEENSWREAGILKGFETSSISSSEELSVLLPSTESKPILPGFPVPKPIGRKRILRPLGCGRTGFLAGTVAFEEVSSAPSMPGIFTIRWR